SIHSTDIYFYFMTDFCHLLSCVFSFMFLELISLLCYFILYFFFFFFVFFFLVFFLFFFFFFFQAEDGIRDYKVTGVQTCALPISIHLRKRPLAWSSLECSIRSLPAGTSLRARHRL